MTVSAVIPPAGGSQVDRPLRLMLVDDSVVARSIFQRILAPFPEFEVAATAASVEQALERLAEAPVDIILLDVEMPGVDGLTALPRLTERGAGARVMIVSSAADVSVRALTLGAVDVLAKPGAGSFGGRFTDMLVEKLRRIGPAPGARAVHAPRKSPRRAGIHTLRPPVTGPVRCIAIGASTGGLHALSAFFRALPPTVRVPILVTQHLPAAFMPYFAAQLRDIAGRPAKVAADGDQLVPGHLLIAPGEGHLSLVHHERGVRVAIDRMAADSGCQPSVDPMLRAAAEMFGAGAVGVVLSGMGRDGAQAAPALVAAGGEMLVQDQDSAVIWGMPGAVATAGHAAAVLPPADIARRIAQRIDAAGQEPATWR